MIEHQREDSAILTLHAHKIYADYKYTAPSLLRRVVAEEHLEVFYRVSELSFSNTDSGASTSEIEIALDALKCVKAVSFEFHESPDGLLRLVSRCPQLEYINLRDSGVTADGLAELHGCKSLSFVDLTATAVSNDAIGALRAALPNVTIASGNNSMRNGNR